MAAYIMADIEILDHEKYAEYRKLTPGTIAQFGGRFIVRGPEPEVLEGEWQPNRMVIIRFDDAEKARAWWNSPEYRPARDLRQSASRGSLILLDGVD
jgi:uncharacterized protein (DUF1330 family)